MEFSGVVVNTAVLVNTNNMALLVSTNNMEDTVHNNVEDTMDTTAITEDVADTTAEADIIKAVVATTTDTMMGTYRTTLSSQVCN